MVFRACPCVSYNQDISIYVDIVQIDTLVRPTSIRTSLKIQGVVVVHVPCGRNTASLLRFEGVLETCDYDDEN